MWHTVQVWLWDDMISIPSVVVGCATHNRKGGRGMEERNKVGLRAFYCVFRLARFGVTFLLLAGIIALPWYGDAIL